MWQKTLRIYYVSSINNKITIRMGLWQNVVKAQRRLKTEKQEWIHLSRDTFKSMCKKHIIQSQLQLL